MTEAVPTVMVETQAQALLLTELQNVHKRLVRLISKIEEEANKAANYANLDTMFLINRTNELPALAATYDSFRNATKWVGCDKDMIAAVCQTEWVRIDYPHTAVPDA